MSTYNISIVEAYYNAMEKKDVARMGNYLHSDVQFIGPLDTKTGKEAVLQAAKHFCVLFKTITIRTKCSSGNDVMLAYDFDFPPPIGKFRAAVLINIEDDLIRKIELFYDPRPLIDKKDNIFS